MFDPGTTLVVRETRAKPGYLLDDTPQTIQIKAGQTVTLEFRNQPLGNLIIEKLGPNGVNHRSRWRASSSKSLTRMVQYVACRQGGTLVLQRSVLDTDASRARSSCLACHRHRGRDEIRTSARASPSTRTRQSQTVAVNPDDTQDASVLQHCRRAAWRLVKANAADKLGAASPTPPLRSAGPATTPWWTPSPPARMAGHCVRPAGRRALFTRSNSESALRISCWTPRRHYFRRQGWGDGHPGVSLKIEAVSGILLHKVDRHHRGWYPWGVVHPLR